MRLEKIPTSILSNTEKPLCKIIHALQSPFMLPTLLFLLLRRYQQKHPEQARLLCAKFSIVLRMALLLLLTAGIAFYAFSQEKVLQYVVKRNGTPVGTMVIKENKSGNRITYKLQSAVKSSFLFTITVKAIEEAIYENGILTYSHLYQKVNSNERVNTEIQANGNAYVIVDQQNVKPLNSYPITYNLVCVYTVEPLHYTRVFVDKFKCFVPIESLGPHHYKITFPDGNYNEYYYKAGICTNVKLNTTWFDAELELKN
jgi:hypothetical protein